MSRAIYRIPIIFIGPRSSRSIQIASPYNIANYNAIDPQYGTEQDLHDFISAAHQLGLQVMLDVVLLPHGSGWRDDDASGLAGAHARDFQVGGFRCHVKALARETLARYERLFAIRKRYAALTSGEVIWINNSEPDNVLSFLRKTEERTFWSSSIFQAGRRT